MAFTVEGAARTRINSQSTLVFCEEKLISSFLEKLTNQATHSSTKVLGHLKTGNWPIAGSGKISSRSYAAELMSRTKCIVTNVNSDPLP